MTQAQMALYRHLKRCYRYNTKITLQDIIHLYKSYVYRSGCKEYEKTLSRALFWYHRAIARLIKTGHIGIVYLDGDGVNKNKHLLPVIEFRISPLFIASMVER